MSWTPRSADLTTLAECGVMTAQMYIDDHMFRKCSEPVSVPGLTMCASTESWRPAFRFGLEKRSALSSLSGDGYLVVMF